METIGRFAERMQVPAKTLRHWEARGLLAPRRLRSGYRCYGGVEVERVHAVLALQDAGLTLGEIRRLLAERARPSEIAALLRARREALAVELRRGAERLSRLDARVAALEGTGEAATRIVLRHLPVMRVASLRGRLIAHEAYVDLFAELDRAVTSAPGALRGAIWHACSARGVECEVFVELPAGAAPSAGRSRVRSLGGSRTAVVTYRGDTDYLPVYALLRRFVHDAGIAAAGPKLELFPPPEPGANPLTEIHLPVVA